MLEQEQELEQFVSEELVVFEDAKLEDLFESVHSAFEFAHRT